MLKEVMMVTIDLSSRMFVLMLYCSAKNIELLFFSEPKNAFYFDFLILELIFVL